MLGLIIMSQLRGVPTLHMRCLLVLQDNANISPTKSNRKKSFPELNY